MPNHQVPFDWPIHLRSFYRIARRRAWLSPSRPLLCIAQAWKRNDTDSFEQARQRQNTYTRISGYENKFSHEVSTMADGGWTVAAVRDHATWEKCTKCHNVVLTAVERERSESIARLARTGLAVCGHDYVVPCSRHKIANYDVTLLWHDVIGQ